MRSSLSSCLPCRVWRRPPPRRTARRSSHRRRPNSSRLRPADPSASHDARPIGRRPSKPTGLTTRRLKFSTRNALSEECSSLKIEDDSVDRRDLLEELAFGGPKLLDDVF